MLVFVRSTQISRLAWASIFVWFRCFTHLFHLYALAYAKCYIICGSNFFKRFFNWRWFQWCKFNKSEFVPLKSYRTRCAHKWCNDQTILLLMIAYCDAYLLPYQLIWSSVRRNLFYFQLLMHPQVLSIPYCYTVYSFIIFYNSNRNAVCLWDAFTEMQKNSFKSVYVIKVSLSLIPILKMFRYLFCWKF